MQQIILHLSVPKYVKKILEFKYGKDYKAREDTLLGMAVLNTLQKKRERNYSSSTRENPDAAFFSIKVGIDKASRKGYQNDHLTAQRISKAIERDIREKLYSEAITNEINYRIDFKTTIQNFLDLYDITEEELSYDTIRKGFNRYKYENHSKFK